MQIGSFRHLMLLSIVVCAAVAFPREASADPFPDDLAAAGDISGRITLTAGSGSPPPMLSPYARRRYAPPAASGTAESPENVVVYVQLARGGGAPAQPTATILQRDRTILPHVTVIQRGTRVDFPNGDQVFHNLFSLSDAKRFNLGRYAPGDSRQVTFDRAGIVRMFSDIHSEMSGTVLVLDTPYFARPGADGRFRIRGVPAGRHTLIAWHESAGTVRTEVVVTDGGNVQTDLRLPG